MLPALLFQDERFVVLDKPAGGTGAAGPRGGVSVEDWFPLLSRRRAGPWLAHRLDADTAGCLVIALRRAALHAAQAAFAGGTARKEYWAVVRGRPAGEAGWWMRPLQKRTGPGGWRMVAEPSGQAAVTAWRMMGTAEGMAWLSLRPRTGRTHQIRIHCALLGCPLLGDPVYGDGTGRLHLLARSIELPLAPPLVAVAPPPAHMLAALLACGFVPGTAPVTAPVSSSRTG